MTVEVTSMDYIFISFTINIYVLKTFLKSSLISLLLVVGKVNFRSIQVWFITMLVFLFAPDKFTTRIVQLKIT